MIKLKYMPEITFVLDTGEEKAARIDELLRKVEAGKVEHVPEG